MTSAAEITRRAPDRSQIGAVVGAVRREVADIAGQVDDDDLSGRLSKASALLDWLNTELTVDRKTESEAESQLLSIDSSAPAASAERRESLLRLRALRDSSVSAADTTPAAGRTEQRIGIPDVDQVTAYLDSRHSGDRAHAVRALTGGYSKVTLLVAATIDGADKDIVLRQTPAGRQSRSLGPEFDVVRFVHGHGLPAPRPLWIEPADNALGGAFFVTERADGENIGDVWGTDGATKELCLEIADLYARLHQIPLDGVNAPVSPRGNKSELSAMIEWQRSVLDKRGITIEPVLAALLQWLTNNIPNEAPRRSLVHGDAAFSNLLIKDGHISAVLDWEAAHIGDAADELAYLKPSVEPIMPWTEFVDRYVEAGGFAPTEESMKFFEVWSHVWRYIGCLWLSQNFETTGRYESAVAAFVHGPRFLDEAVTAAFL